MVLTAKAIVGNSDFLTCQALTFESQEGGDLVAILISAAGEDAFAKVRQSALELKDEFFASTESLPLAERVSAHLNILTEKLNSLESLQILFTAYSKNALYIKGFGGHQALLLRDKQVISLDYNASDQLISGYLQNGDRLLLLSAKDMSDPFWEQNLVDRLFTVSRDALEEELNIFVEGFEQIPAVAAVLIDSVEAEEASVAPRSQKVNNPAPPMKIKLTVPEFRLPKPHFNFKLANFQRRRIRKSWLLILAVVVFIILAGSNFIKFFQNTRVDDSASDQTVVVTNQSTNSSEVREFPVYLSLDLIKSGINIERMALSVDTLILLDDKEKSLVAVDLNNKTTQILAGRQQLGNAYYAGINGDLAYVYSEDKGIVRVDLNSRVADTVVAKDSSWGSITDFVAYAGNLYALDIRNSQIWKYVPIESGFTEAQTYFQDETLNLADSKRFQIDGSVWILKTGPKIDKYTAGVGDFFSVSGMEQSLGDFETFFLSDKTENIYILDKENSRVVKLNKKGEYQSQMTGDKFKTADDLVVLEEQNKLFLLENNVIFELPL